MGRGEGGQGEKEEGELAWEPCAFIINDLLDPTPSVNVCMYACLCMCTTLTHTHTHRGPNCSLQYVYRQVGNSVTLDYPLPRGWTILGLHSPTPRRSSSSSVGATTFTETFKQPFTVPYLYLFCFYWLSVPLYAGALPYFSSL